MDIVTQTMQESGIGEKIAPSKITKVLSAFTLVIRELVRRGNLGGQFVEEIRENLSILFNILEKGVKHYDAK